MVHGGLPIPDLSRPHAILDSDFGGGLDLHFRARDIEFENRP